jgi:adenylosuccinate lyase
MLAASKAVRQHAGLMLDAMVQDFERATGPWHAEWMAIPESFVLTAGALNQAKFALAGLIVDERKMDDNLAISRGLIVAEAVMMGLAPQIGRQGPMMWSMTPAGLPPKAAFAWRKRWRTIPAYPAGSIVPRSRR